MLQKSKWKSWVLLALSGVLATGLISWQENPSPSPEFPTTDTIPKGTAKKIEMEKAKKEFEKAKADLERSLRKAAKDVKEWEPEIDADELRAEVHKALQELDAEKLKEEMQQSRREIHSERIRAQLEAALAKVEVEKLKAEIAQWKKGPMANMEAELKKIRPQIEAELKKAEKEIEKARLRLNEYD